MISHNNKQYLSTKEFLEKLPVGLIKLPNLLGMINRGSIEAIKVGGSWFVAESMLLEIIKPNSYKSK